MQRHEANEFQRRRQQGLGRGIVSAEVNGTRFVAVNNKVMYGKRWNTFTDFLGDYIKAKVGEEWGNNEIHNKPDDKRHPIIKWYQKICLLQSKYKNKVHGLYQMPKTGAVSAYYGLAYDLYCLDHNAALQEALLARLKNPDQNFYGVRYEIAVAATMIRGGFAVEFEDESDRRTTHCEFTATSSRTGKQFSVECKRLESSPGDGLINIKKLGTRFTGALRKKANFSRIVFMDLNFPYDPKINKTFPKVMDAAIHHIRKFEANPQNGGDLPSAFIFLTNAPYIHHLDDESVSLAVITEGFKIPEYKPDKAYELREAIDNREKHSDIHHLLESIRLYSEIPSTFDGEIPEFSFNKELQKNRLLIGEAYLIPDESGRDVKGVLEEGLVLEGEGKAAGVFRLEDGKRVLVKCDLSAEELTAYKNHPDTFFGGVNKNNRQANSALELYDFFFESFKDGAKEMLLGHFKNAPNFEDLKDLPQIELARLYAEHCVRAAMYQQQKK